MAELTQTQKPSERVFGKKTDSNTCKSAIEGNTSASPLCPIYVRYKDHVIFKNISAPSPIAVVRETIGWVKEQNDELLLIEHDRAIPSQGKSVNGIIILKNCILEAFPLLLQNNSEWVLSSRETNCKVELAFRPSERKTHGAKDSKRKSQTC
jgi:hypothetical protein